MPLLSRLSKFVYRYSSKTGSRLLLILIALLAASAARAADPLLTTFESILSLSEKEAMQAHPVEVEGVVVAEVKSRSMVVIWNGTRGLALYSQRTNALLRGGQRVRVEGTTVSQGNVRVVANKIQLLGEPGPMPEPRVASLEELRGDSGTIEWVRTTGVIKRAQNFTLRARLQLRDRGATVAAWLFRPEGKMSVTKYQHATVEVTGLLVPSRDPGRWAVNELWIIGIGGIKVLNPPISDAFSHSLTSVEDAASYPYKDLPFSRTHLRGRVTMVDTNSITLHDETGAISIVPLNVERVKEGDLVEVVGYLEKRPGGNVLDAGIVRGLGLPRRAIPEINAEGLPLSWEGYMPVIRSVGEVRDLTEEEVAAQPLVRIQAQVLLKHSQQGHYYVHDGTGGIILKPENVPEDTRPGMLLSLTGYATPGPHSSVLTASWVETSSFRPMVKSVAVTSQGLQAGRQESQWVHIGGVVRKVTPSASRLHLVLARPAGRFDVFVHGGTLAEAEPLIGAKVEVNAVVERIVNRAGQVNGSRLLVPGLENIEIVRPADTDVEGRDPIRIRDLLDPAERYGYFRPGKIEGTVSLIRHGSVFIEGEDTSIEALVAGRPRGVSVGDRVTATGYLRQGQLRPLLEDARIEKLDARGELTVNKAPAQRILDSGLNGRLVSLTGTLISKSPIQREYSIVLADSSQAFAVVMDMANVTPEVRALREGSVLRVTGICDFAADRNGNPQSFRILLRTPEDIQVIQPPPRISNERLLMMVVGMALIIILSLAWVSFLRRRVERTEKRFTKAFSASPIPVALATKDFTFLDVNLSFLARFGYGREDVIEKSATELNLFAVTGTEESVRRLLAESKTVQDLESEIRSKSGRHLNVLISAEYIELDQQEVLLIQLQDVTERTALMNQLRESQKMEAVGQLAAGVAHDFNNLLTIIRGNSDLIKQSADNPKDVIELNGELDQATTRAEELTRQLLTFSRHSVFRPRVFDLNEAIESSGRMVARMLGETIDVQLDLVAGTPSIQADPGMIDQIIINLGVNARDAMPKGGRLILSTRLVTLTKLEVESDPDALAGDFVVLGVADNGEGMNLELQQQVFEPFFTTKEIGKGTGLGLSTVYGIMQQHEGWVSVESELGKGTRFDLFFPAMEPADVDTEKPSELVEQDGAGATILLVEDELGVARMTARLLQNLGYRVLNAENGQAARKVWARHGENVDLLLTDMVLPAGLSGLDLANEFSAARPELPIIFVSGYSEDLIKADGAEEPNRHFLAKPYSRKQLVTLIRNCLEPVEQCR
ncbi:MAG: two-component system cell cycle sensor histidine kinase/response regulator CckA [Limisphaerales bacterium]|jgi:two-component system cell cycle sensor histidine kinase/response regulator CckA